MKVTFELPPLLVQRFRAHVPTGERSKFVADLISRKLQGESTVPEQSAQKANKLPLVNREMKHWEALNVYAE